ncbi:PDR/VanB family oxidoreductase [Xylophilus sp. GOD-11R]|uniref:PDR/VanB family oxidoreductase n=1 Tax=Xylophilus sp. GOD-11R TaxID=3089814 RepID=UPI00298CB29E|nr:PDR/VanB family oxidoreductase [Xylophilus sp. GOD-11R]WPB56139.1 PDR/VanB family oxidoreductase [Xylophilus sp. GOD-11R]
MTLDAIVSAATVLPGRVLHLRLRSRDGSPLPRFEPGAHVDVHLGTQLVRQYSLCGDPEDDSEYQLAILLAEGSRGGSLAAHGSAAPGAPWTLGVPRNLFPLADGRSGAILLAGGIGITPLLSMAWRLHRSGRPFRLHYAVRRRADAAFADLLQGTPFADRVIIYADDDLAPLPRLDFAAAIGAPRADTHVYACGPSGFMAAAQAGAARLGWPAAHYHQEHFQAGPDDADAAEAAGDRPFTVCAARSGVTVEIPVGRSISDVLKGVGVTVWTSCEQGVCGTCLTPLLEGEADHRDRYQTSAEMAAQTQVALCCSRARSPTLVLDL